MAATTLKSEFSILEIGDEKRHFEIEKELFDYHTLYEDGETLPVMIPISEEQLENVIEMGRNLKKASELIPLFLKKERYYHGKLYWDKLDEICNLVIKLVFYYRKKDEKEIFDYLIPNRKSFEIVKDFVKNYKASGGRTFYIRALQLLSKSDDLEIIQDCYERIDDHDKYNVSELLTSNNDSIFEFGLGKVKELEFINKLNFLFSAIIYWIKNGDDGSGKCYNRIINLINCFWYNSDERYKHFLESKIKCNVKNAYSLEDYLKNPLIKMDEEMIEDFECYFEISNEQKFIHYCFNERIDKAEELYNEEFLESLSIRKFFEFSCKYGKLKCVKYLMTKKDFSRLVRDLYMSSACETNVETIKYLLENGGFLNECMDAAFFNALRNGNILVAKYIYSQYKDYSSYQIPGEGPDGAVHTLEESFVELCEKSSFDRSIENIIELLEFIMSIKDIDSGVINDGFMNFHEVEVLDWIISKISNETVIQWLEVKSNRYNDNYVFVLEKVDLLGVSEETIKKIWENLRIFDIKDLYKLELFEGKVKLDSDSEVISKIKTDIEKLKTTGYR